MHKTTPDDTQLVQGISSAKVEKTCSRVRRAKEKGLGDGLRYSKLVSYVPSQGSQCLTLTSPFLYSVIALPDQNLTPAFLNHLPGLFSCLHFCSHFLSQEFSPSVLDGTTPSPSSERAQRHLLPLFYTRAQVPIYFLPPCFVSFYLSTWIGEVNISCFNQLQATPWDDNVIIYNEDNNLININNF